MTYLWQDEKTGALHHELVYLEPAPFETALAWAQTHAPTRGVERIHVKHERGKKALARKPRASPAAGKRVAKKAPAKKVARRRTEPARCRQDPNGTGEGRRLTRISKPARLCCGRGVVQEGGFYLASIDAIDFALLMRRTASPCA